MTGLRVLFCGSRRFASPARMREAFEILRPAFVIEGGQRGADTLARFEARRRGIPFVTERADWSRGPCGGPERNQRMLDRHRPELVVAFPLKGSVGTLDMVERARKAGVEVRVVEKEQAVAKGLGFACGGVLTASDCHFVLFAATPQCDLALAPERIQRIIENLTCWIPPGQPAKVRKEKGK